MNERVRNYIGVQYQELSENSTMNLEYERLYEAINNEKLRITLALLHYDLIGSFKIMNERLPISDSRAYFGAEPSRKLIKTIEMIIRLRSALKQSEYAFDIDGYYLELIKKCRGFLRSSGGSPLPEYMEKIELYVELPIFKLSDSIEIETPSGKALYPRSHIGDGSYAHVYVYTDTFYGKQFAIKQANKNLSAKELQRFRREFDTLKELLSPHIIEVYYYNDEKNEYCMEYMDGTLENFIKKNNSLLPVEKRKGIVFQILRAFRYIHSKNILHRDISPKNILMKEYDGILVVKVSDFGLVKIPESSLTTVGTEFKGYFNDPILYEEGFDKYDKPHEIYALTKVVCYVMTGKENMNEIKKTNMKGFLIKGTNRNDIGQRFQTVEEMETAFRAIKDEIK